MPSAYTWIPITDFRGGRNAADDPLSLAENQVVQARNGDFHRTALFRKRGGAAAPSIGSAFTGVISSLLRHLPGNNPALAELWGVDDAATPVVGRMAAASTFTSVTLKDNVATSPAKVRGASFNGKFFLAYDSTADRLHVWDPNLASPQVRRVGLATPAAPTVANTGSGSYAATIRYYRVRYRIKTGSAVTAQSEASSSTSFTPSGTGTAARITKPATINESETHWVVEASADNLSFYEIAEVVVGTTTYDDSAAVSSYSSSPLSAVTGAYTAPSSFKYVIAAFNRLLGAGSWEGGRQSRLWFTPATGTSDRADDERIPNTTEVKNFQDFDEGTGGDITGFAGPVYESVYLFKYSNIRKLIPTGVGNPVFDSVWISHTSGAIDQEMIAVGVDSAGRDMIYYLDGQKGPMMTGPIPPTEIGQGVRDQWDTVNLAATTKVGQVVFYPSKGAKGQVWWWWATGSNNEPNLLAIYDVLTGGWTVFDTGGRLRLARCAVSFARTLGASMSRDLVPYIGYSSSNNSLLRADTSDTDDASTTFQASVKSRPYAFNNGKLFRASNPLLVFKAASGVTLTVTLDFDLGRTTYSGTVNLTPAGSESRVFVKVEGLDATDARVLQIEIGDAAAISNTWTLERIWVPVRPLDESP